MELLQFICIHINFLFIYFNIRSEDFRNHFIVKKNNDFLPELSGWNIYKYDFDANVILECPKNYVIITILNNNNNNNPSCCSYFFFQ